MTNQTKFLQESLQEKFAQLANLIENSNNQADLSCQNNLSWLQNAVQKNVQEQLTGLKNHLNQRQEQENAKLLEFTSKIFQKLRTVIIVGFYFWVISKKFSTHKKK